MSSDERKIEALEASLIAARTEATWLREALERAKVYVEHYVDSTPYKVCYDWCPACAIEAALAPGAATEAARKLRAFEQLEEWTQEERVLLDGPAIVTVAPKGEAEPDWDKAAIFKRATLLEAIETAQEFEA